MAKIIDDVGCQGIEGLETSPHDVGDCSGRLPRDLRLNEDDRDTERTRFFLDPGELGIRGLVALGLDGDWA